MEDGEDGRLLQSFSTLQLGHREEFQELLPYSVFRSLTARLLCTAPSRHPFIETSCDSRPLPQVLLPPASPNMPSWATVRLDVIYHLALRPNLGRPAARLQYLGLGQAGGPSDERAPYAEQDELEGYVDFEPTVPTIPYQHMGFHIKIRHPLRGRHSPEARRWHPIPSKLT